MKNIRHKISATSLAISVWLVPYGALAKSIKQEESVVKFQKFEKLSVEFEQKTYKAVRKKTLRRKGRALFAKPNKFRWIYESPDQEELVFDGATLWRYFPEEKQASRFAEASGAVGEIETIVAMVLDPDKLNKRYIVSTQTKAADKGTLELMMKPRKGVKNQIKSIKLSFNPKGLIVSIMMLYQSANSTTVVFSNHKTKFDLAALKFTPPAGVAVTDVR
jgi:outer membrane lipoprotein carrier protein